MAKQSIPASAIVNITPAVLSGGGHDLSFNAVLLSKNINLPSNQVTSFASAQSVGDFFGLASAEYEAAKIYFGGFDNSTIKPATLLFYPYNVESEPAVLRSGSLKSMKLSELKKINGALSVVVDGATFAGSVDFASASSFSEAAGFISQALNGVTVQFDEQLQAFKMQSGSIGSSAEIQFATGDIAEALKLTENKGAVISVGAIADTPATVMDGCIKSTQNFVTFTTLHEPTIDEKLALAKWSNDQNDRFLYVAWGKEENALQTGNTTCLGAQLKDVEMGGVTAIYGGLDKAVFLCGAIASVDFKETKGRVNFAFKGQGGLQADVTNETDAQNLIENGYNFYGAYATANDRFLLFYPAQMSSKWKWIDSYINQIRINSQLQLSLMNLLVSAKSIPYNADGIALQRAACQDAINEALNFGSIQLGVSELSETQKSIINQTTDFDAVAQIVTKGYYLHVANADAQARTNRQSMPMKFWYTDGQSVLNIDLASINIQ